MGDVRRMVVCFSIDNVSGRCIMDDDDCNGHHDVDYDDDDDAKSVDDDTWSCICVCLWMMAYGRWPMLSDCTCLMHYLGD